MVTEVQSKMYIPGYYSMNGGWALARDNGPLKTAHHHHHHYAVYAVDFEKEKLRQTIVKHDSIFRQQVYELHRVYRKQRDLMSEVRSKHKVEEQLTIRFARGPRGSEAVDFNNSDTPQRMPFDFDLEIPASEVDGDKRRTLNLADLNEPIEIDDEDSGLCNIGDEKMLFSEKKTQSHVYADIWFAAKQFSENRLLGNSGKTKNEAPSRTEDFRKPGESSEVLKAPVKRKIFGVEVVAEANHNNKKELSEVAESEPSSTLSEAGCREVKLALPWLTIQDDTKIDSNESSNARKMLSFRPPQIDLNECFVEEEEEETRFTGIDLEASPPPEENSDDEEEEAIAAAKALSAIRLRFLADAISKAEREEEEEEDEFEQNVLRLKEERVHVATAPHPPTPAPESWSPARRRRGRAKDFRREVLPGMASLTRNEVTEDLQIMEGLVRATGGTWHAINNAARGRTRRHLAPPRPELAAWGNRTRRLPRHRSSKTDTL